MRLRAGEEVHAAPERDRSARAIASRQPEAMLPYRPGALRTHRAASVRGGTGGAMVAPGLETGRAVATARTRAHLRPEPCAVRTPPTRTCLGAAQCRTCRQPQPAPSLKCSRERSYHKLVNLKTVSL